MKKYKRRTINQRPELHDKWFITTEDAEQALILLANLAVKCGADEDKLMEFFGNDEKD